ncbi:alpha/beta hydrolase [Phenylobacterium sp.]|jgi:acetyl esterase/lipase|uniref:alpha/beta hydrolase n=1 Tax=Phenylobacterium sp. TaxID=1871053 RepID=UPI002F931655
MRLAIPIAVLVLAGAAHAEPAPLKAYMEQARVQPSARIAYGQAPSQVVELFLPKGRGPHPVVVLLHGGCFLKQFEGLPQTSGIAADLARRGMAVWNVEYRRLPEPGAGYPGTFEDVAAAIDRIAADAARYDLDATRVVALGHSAGGHLALWAAARGKLPQTSPLYREAPVRLRAAISLAGIGDLEGQGDVFGRPCGQETLPQLIGFKDRKAAYADTSPAALLPTGARIVMVHGVFDPVMPPYTGLAFADRARKAGDAAEVVILADAAHFDPVIPTTPAWRAVARVVEREAKRLR